MTNSFHATPYDVSAKGFYFSTYEQWVERAAKHRNDYGEPVEEYEIQFIDGDSYELFNAIGVNQANLERWFTEFEELEGEDRIKIIYLLDHAGYNLENALDNIDDVSLFEGSAKEYVYDFIDSTGLLDQIPEHLRFYFDFDAFTRDMLLSGDITEVTINNTNYVAWSI